MQSNKNHISSSGESNVPVKPLVQPVVDEGQLVRTSLISPLDLRPFRFLSGRSAILVLLPRLQTSAGPPPPGPVTEGYHTSSPAPFHAPAPPPFMCVASFPAALP